MTLASRSTLGSVSVGRVAVGEEHADVGQTGGAQHGVDHGVGHDVGVGVPDESQRVGDLDAAQHKTPSGANRWAS